VSLLGHLELGALCSSVGLGSHVNVVAKDRIPVLIAAKVDSDLGHRVLWLEGRETFDGTQTVARRCGRVVSQRDPLELPNVVGAADLPGV
jgi:hypothetical protein